MRDQDTMVELLQQVHPVGDEAFDNANVMAIGYIFIAIAQAHEVSLADLIKISTKALIDWRQLQQAK